MELYDLKLNGVQNPMGFSFPDLRCSWKVRNARSKKASWTKVQVSLSSDFEELLYEKEGAELDCTGVKLDLPLQPCTTYYYRVLVTGDQGETGASPLGFLKPESSLSPGRLSGLALTRLTPFIRNCSNPSPLPKRSNGPGCISAAWDCLRPISTGKRWERIPWPLL